jgi:hypothetical protein
MTDKEFWMITRTVAATKPKWSKIPPTVNGLYWMKLRPKYKGQKDANRIWLMYLHGHFEIILPEDVGIREAMPLVMNEWAGPLTPPD